MRILAIAVAILLVASSAGALNEPHFKNLWTLNACEKCDLSGAIFCKTKTPWGIDISGSKKTKKHCLLLLTPGPTKM